jgi:sialidase-1
MPGISRRALLSAAGGAAAWTFMGPPCRAAAAPAKVHEIKTISRRPDLYHGWPTIVRCRSGRLLVTYSGGRETHVCPFGRVELIESTDNGVSWSKPRVIIDTPLDDRDTGVLETAKGTILVTTFTSLAYESILARAEKVKPGEKGAWPPARLKRWQAAHARVTAQCRRDLLGVWLVRSTDGGKTWSKLIDCLVDSPHGPIQLADGRLLYAGKDLWRPGGRTGVCESCDDGCSWRWLADLPVRTGDSHAQYHELHAVETTDRQLVLQIRNHNKANGGETLQSESSDGGKTWSVPHSIGVLGHPSHLLRLRDGRLLMTYGHRYPPLGNQARLSEDGGRTWLKPIIISSDGGLVSDPWVWAWKDARVADFGYPASAQLGDGSLLTVWYEATAAAPRAVLRQAHWSLES